MSHLLDDVLEALHTRQNDQVLPITVHVMLHPTRIALLDADGNRREWEVFDGELKPALPDPPKVEALPTDDGKPPAQRITIEGMDVALYGALGG